MTVTGKVTDQQGTPLINAAVYFSGSDGKYINGNAATTTDENGNYILRGTESPYVTASYTGYTTRTMHLNQMVNFEMRTNNNLQEVNILGSMLWPRIAIILIVIIVTIWLLKPFS